MESPRHNLPAPTDSSVMTFHHALSMEGLAKRGLCDDTLKAVSDLDYRLFLQDFMRELRRIGDERRDAGLLKNFYQELRAEARAVIGRNAQMRSRA